MEDLLEEPALRSIEDIEKSMSDCSVLESVDFFEVVRKDSVPEYITDFLEVVITEPQYTVDDLVLRNDQGSFMTALGLSRTNKLTDQSLALNLTVKLSDINCERIRELQTLHQQHTFTLPPNLHCLEKINLQPVVSLSKLSYKRIINEIKFPRNYSLVEYRRLKLVEDKQDIDWTIRKRVPTTTPKVTQPWTNQLRFLKKILMDVSRLKCAIPFLHLVDLQAVGNADYYRAISRPMCINTIRERLQNLYYRDAGHLLDNWKLMLFNAIRFNGETSEVCSLAIEMDKKFRKKLKFMPKDLMILSIPSINGSKLKKPSKSEEKTISGLSTVEPIREGFEVSQSSPPIPKLRLKKNRDVWSLCKEQPSLVCSKDDDLPCSPLGPLTVTEITKNSCKLTWSTTQPSEDYRFIVDRKDICTGKWFTVGIVETTEMVVDGLQSNRSYTFRVKTLSTNGLSGPLETEEPILMFNSQENSAILKEPYTTVINEAAGLFTTNDTANLNPENPFKSLSSFETTHPSQTSFGSLPSTIISQTPVQKSPFCEVRLSSYVKDLNMEINPNGLEGKPLDFKEFDCSFAGVKGTVGFSSGRIMYEVKFLEADISASSISLMVGWSDKNAGLALGNQSISVGYESNGRFHVQGEIVNGVLKFEAGDTITCFADIRTEEIEVSFLKNNSAVSTSINLKREGLTALFPHILSQNVKFSCNFGSQPTSSAVAEGFKFPNFAQHSVPEEASPTDFKSSKVLIMVGLHGTGLTTWAIKHARTHAHQHFHIIGHSYLNMRHQPKLMDNIERRIGIFRDKMLDIAATTLGNYIIDETHLGYKAQRNKIQKFRHMDVTAVVLFPPDIQTLYQRVTKNGYSWNETRNHIDIFWWPSIKKIYPEAEESQINRIRHINRNQAQPNVQQWVPPPHSYQWVPPPLVLPPHNQQWVHPLYNQQWVPPPHTHQWIPSPHSQQLVLTPQTHQLVLTPQTHQWVPPPPVIHNQINFHGNYRRGAFEGLNLIPNFTQSQDTANPTVPSQDFSNRHPT